MKRVLVITGSPGIGKTTTLIKTVAILKKNGYTVGGMISREVRKEGIRIGFEILDLTSEKRGWLAHVNQKIGPAVGKYRVNLQDLEFIGVQAILKAVENCDVIVIDEIGPMELYSEKFRETARKALKSFKTIVVVVHWKSKDRLIEEAKAMKTAKIFTVNLENRELLSQKIAEESIQGIEKANESAQTISVL